jgi:N-acetyl-beta-hexosaminidase
MKSLRFSLSALLLSAAAFAGTWSGTVVDVNCKAKDLAKHTRQCALGCAKSGFGVVLADGKFVKFDEAGNAKTVEMLKAATKEADLKVEVSGTLHGEVLHVDSIKLQ